MIESDTPCPVQSYFYCKSVMLNVSSRGIEKRYVIIVTFAFYLQILREMKCIILLTLLYGVLGMPVEDEAFQEFVNGSLKFTAAVYKEIGKDDNLIVSPLSAEIILALTNEGAKGDTAAELMTGLSLPSSKEKTQQAIKLFLPNLKKSDKGLKLLSANKIYINNDLKLEDDFKSIATTIYDSAVENIDFNESNKASITINNWVEENTNHKIRNLIKPGDIRGDTKIILINALYFNGKWASKFQEHSTIKKKFFKNEKDSVDVATMRQTNYFNYYEHPTLNVKFLELSYAGADISMTVVLPNEIEGLKSLKGDMDQLLASYPFTIQKVNVELPRFTIESEIEFVPILKNLGIRKLFSDADLQGLSSTDKNLFVSKVIQKAFINVTESGTEAAAATAVIVAGITSVNNFVPPPINFHADHPFLYLIKSNGVVLFIGQFTNPKP